MSWNWIVCRFCGVRCGKHSKQDNEKTQVKSERGVCFKCHCKIEK